MQTYLKVNERNLFHCFANVFTIQGEFKVYSDFISDFFLQINWNIPISHIWYARVLYLLYRNIELSKALILMF